MKAADSIIHFFVILFYSAKAKIFFTKIQLCEYYFLKETLPSPFNENKKKADLNLEFL